MEQNRAQANHQPSDHWPIPTGYAPFSGPGRNGRFGVMGVQHLHTDSLESFPCKIIHTFLKTWWMWPMFFSGNVKSWPPLHSFQIYNFFITNIYIFVTCRMKICDILKTCWISQNFVNLTPTPFIYFRFKTFSITNIHLAEEVKHVPQYLFPGDLDFYHKCTFFHQNTNLLYFHNSAK